MEKGTLLREIHIGEVHSTEQWFDLHAFFKRFQTQFGALAESRRVILELSVSEEIPSIFLGDPIRLNDLMKNLFTYVFNHLDDGCIYIDVQATPVLPNEYRLSITFTNNGSGLPYSTLNTLFLPATSTGRQGHNSLYIAKTIAVLMKGDVTVENTFGWGVKYCAHLKLKTEEPICYAYSLLKGVSTSPVHSEQ